MEIIILAAWGIWISRNKKIFNNIMLTLESWKYLVFSELYLLSHRMKNKHIQSFNEWRNNLM
jgi:hypothetical protein